jgi:acetyl-CoA decarbonylase/synthase complex subunit beta
MSDLQDNVSRAHNHGAGAQLDPAAEAILQRGLRELLCMADGLKFRPLPGETYPLPLVRAAYAAMPTPEAVRADVQERMNSDPASVLEYALALLELHECNQGDIAQYVQEDMPFISTCFSSKRCNGWIALMGDADRAEAEAAINRRWQFKFFSGRAGPTGVYALLNMLARYGFVYGRVEAGDAHGLSHFVEEYCPGLIVCRGRMSDLELTLSLAAMKMGIPAIVPGDYPFRLGRMLRMDTLNEVVESVCAFPNIRRLLRTPEIPPMPDYCDAENAERAFTVHATWGDTPESFFIVRKGRVASPGVAVSGRAGKGIGVEVTIEAEPMDAFDRRYIESSIAGSLSLVRGAKVRFDAQTFAIDMAEQTDLTAERVGEVLLAAVRRTWPKLDRVRAAVCFDPEQLRRRAPVVREEKAARGREILAATEENADRFYQCVGCSPFAPDHVCCLTPERPPQCARPFEMIKTGALYGYDDMTNIHHSAQHREINSFRAVEKGRCLDAERGEWEGLNANAAQLTGGRTTRILLHSVADHPHTGCGCFRVIMFQTEKPRAGIAIMDSGFTGRAPDGRSWRDLHYALAGKQTAGMAGAAPQYFFSRKFLRAHGGWKSVVWVSPKVAASAGDALPKGIEIGSETA